MKAKCRKAKSYINLQNQHLDKDTGTDQPTEDDILYISLKSKT